jgi:hypothetical protein
VLSSDHPAAGGAPPFGLRPRTSRWS